MAWTKIYTMNQNYLDAFQEAEWEYIERPPPYEIHVIHSSEFSKRLEDRIRIKAIGSGERLIESNRYWFLFHLKSWKQIRNELKIFT